MRSAASLVFAAAAAWARRVATNFGHRSLACGNATWALNAAHIGRPLRLDLTIAPMWHASVSGTMERGVGSKVMRSGGRQRALTPCTHLALPPYIRSPGKRLAGFLPPSGELSFVELVLVEVEVPMAAMRRRP